MPNDAYCPCHVRTQSWENHASDCPKGLLQEGLEIHKVYHELMTPLECRYCRWATKVKAILLAVVVAAGCKRAANRPVVKVQNWTSGAAVVAEVPTPVPTPDIAVRTEEEMWRRRKLVHVGMTRAQVCAIYGQPERRWVHYEPGEPTVEFWNYVSESTNGFITFTANGRMDGVFAKNPYEPTPTPYERKDRIVNLPDYECDKEDSGKVHP